MFCILVSHDWMGGPDHAKCFARPQWDLHNIIYHKFAHIESEQAQARSATLEDTS